MVKSLKITILSTMLTDTAGIGEWGFAALVEADGHRILFDTGRLPETVLQNAKALGISLSDIEDVVLSHNHADHTGGLVTLRRELSRENPDAVSRTHVARGIFWGRPPDPRGPSMPVVKEGYERIGGIFIERAEPVEIHPGIWLTGPVPRTHSERNYGRGGKVGQVESPDGPVEDNIPESQSLVVNTPRGLVVMSGCGHAGIINIVDYARKIIGPAPIHAVLGGFHLMEAAEEQLVWTGDMLREREVENLIGAHCTGIEALFRLRQGTGLARQNAVVGAVGASFSLEKGIDPLMLAR
jgi:7,8-dihydropterin-6-yl-methyl-4-(beta-D-ribofuranosyl)aminobenzene 5'-phosphate synthase